MTNYRYVEIRREKRQTSQITLMGEKDSDIRV